ncbi:unnamed protein product [Amoebophrya sp. A120]|nr:unnamed protein product [Amoebophrya sp. A120]|eukprot:GSA120T00017340001.1
MGSAFGVISEETPAYEVLQRFENYEIRRYEPRVAVQVAMNHANDSTAFKTINCKNVWVWKNPTCHADFGF